jgi:hypothetical protein
LRISPSQGRYLTQTQNKHRVLSALSGIRTHDPSVRAGEDISCLRLPGLEGRGARAGFHGPTLIHTYIHTYIHKHNRPLWVAVQGPNRPTPYTYIHTYIDRLASVIGQQFILDLQNQKSVYAATHRHLKQNCQNVRSEAFDMVKIHVVVVNVIALCSLVCE